MSLELLLAAAAKARCYMYATNDAQNRVELHAVLCQPAMSSDEMWCRGVLGRRVQQLGHL